MDMLHGQRLGSLAGCLSQRLMTDALLHLIAMTAVWMRHRQRLGENLLLTSLVAAQHVADLQYQRGTITQPFRTLDLTVTVAMHC